MGKDLFDSLECLYVCVDMHNLHILFQILTCLELDIVNIGILSTLSFEAVCELKF